MEPKWTWRPGGEWDKGFWELEGTETELLGMYVVEKGDGTGWGGIIETIPHEGCVLVVDADTAEGAKELVFEAALDWLATAWEALTGMSFDDEPVD